MDLQTRKISFVQEFLKLQNEEIISLFEKLLIKGKNSIINHEFHSMTMDEYNKRIDQSMEDSKKGKLTESGKLISEIEKWG